jgi:16S rRNA (uracil1498-N3)-methyltransferase
MRLKSGDSIVMFDGKGEEFYGTINEVDPRFKKIMVVITGRKKLPSENIPYITLAQSIPKKNKMDLVAEKATELGVHRIVPMLTQRTVVRPDKRSSVKMTERWRRIAVETSKQCARAFIPEISEVTDFNEIVKSGKDYDVCLLACLGSETIHLRKAIPPRLSGKVLVLIGPEGDFTPNETEHARNRGFSIISLGSRVLKSETAGLFVVSVLGYEGDIFGECNG